MVEYTQEQIDNILRVYPSVQEMERVTELRQLENWFKEYDVRINQARRYGELNLDWFWEDNVYNKIYTSINELNEQAQLVENRIRMLKI